MKNLQSVEESALAAGISAAVALSVASLIDIYAKEKDGKSFYDKTLKNLEILEASAKEATTPKQKSAVLKVVTKHISDIDGAIGTKLKTPTHSNPFAINIQRDGHLAAYRKNLVNLKNKLESDDNYRGDLFNIKYRLGIGNKKNAIKESFESLRESFTPLNVSNYIAVVKSQPLHTILENATHIYCEPTRGAQFMLDLVTVTEMTISQLENLQEGMVGYYNRCISDRYKNMDHLNALKESLNILGRRLDEVNTDAGLKDDTIYNLNKGFLPRTTLREGSFAQGIESVIYGTNASDANVFQEYSRVMEGINYNDASADLFQLLSKNTSAVIKSSYVNGLDSDSMKGAISLPVSTVTNLIDNGYKASYINAVKCVLKNQLKMVNSCLNSQPSCPIINGYSDALIKSIGMCDERESGIRLNGLNDSELFNAESLADFDFENTDFLDEAVLEHNFSIHYVETFMGDPNNINLEHFNKMMATAHLYSMVREANIIKSAAKSLGNAGNNLAHSATTAIRKGADETRRAGTALKKGPEHVERLLDGTIGKLMKMDRAERRKRIIEGGYKTRLFKMIRTAATVGTISLVSPALAAVSLLVIVAKDKTLDRKVRTRILEDMENELSIINEKIDDAKSANDKDKKYQLMRIKTKLERDIIRIKFNLKDMEDE